MPAKFPFISADIVYSPDDGGWYARTFLWRSVDQFLDGDESPILDSKAEALLWAKQCGATVFLYP